MKDMTRATVHAILAGDLDADLDAIADAVRTRWKVRRQTNDAAMRAELRVGQLVRVSDTVRPERIAGAVGRITAMGRTRVSVTIDGQPWRFHAGSLCPLTSDAAALVEAGR